MAPAQMPPAHRRPLLRPRPAWNGRRRSRRAGSGGAHPMGPAPPPLPTLQEPACRQRRTVRSIVSDNPDASLGCRRSLLHGTDARHGQLPDDNAVVWHQPHGPSRHDPQRTVPIRPQAGRPVTGQVRASPQCRRHGGHRVSRCFLPVRFLSRPCTGRRTPQPVPPRRAPRVVKHRDAKETSRKSTTPTARRSSPTRSPGPRSPGPFQRRPAPSRCVARLQRPTRCLRLRRSRSSLRPGRRGRMQRNQQAESCRQPEHQQCEGDHDVPMWRCCGIRPVSRQALRSSQSRTIPASQDSGLRHPLA